MHSTVEVNDGVSREPARYKKFQKTRIHSNVLPHWILLTVNNSRKRLLRERMVDAAHLVFKRPFVAFLLLFHVRLPRQQRTYAPFVPLGALLRVIPDEVLCHLGSRTSGSGYQ